MAHTDSGFAFEAVDFDHWPYPRQCAHRGAGKLAPENTLAALRVGAQHGYRMFEFDAKLSGDGTLVLMHDATLDRTTSGRARVSARALGDMMKLDAGSWHSPEYAGEGIPTLWRAGTWLIANGLYGNIEIKPCPGREAETGAAVAIEAASLWGRQPIAPLLSSFSEDALRAAQNAVPQIPRALLLDSLPSDWLARCRNLGCVAVNLNYRLLTRQIIEHAHSARLHVLCYTLNDPDLATQWLNLGVDCIVTDAIDKIPADATPASAPAGPPANPAIAAPVAPAPLAPAPAPAAPAPTTAAPEPSTLPIAPTADGAVEDGSPADQPAVPSPS